jgi:acetyl coenzyme A synthetase (ADP forming)-like protein
LNADARQYAADAILRDGGSIHIRAIRPNDKRRLVEHFSRVSPESIYFRFFGMKKQLTEKDLKRFTELDFVGDVVLVATLRHNGDERIVGFGCYMAADGRGGHPTRAEVAFLVEDAFQGRGVGTLLLEHLAPIARANGITEFVADVLGENNKMIEVFAQSGFKAKRYVDAGMFHISFPTKVTEQVVEAKDRREREAAARSLRAFLNPRSVAIVGASRRAGTIGAALVENVKRCGFTGAIHPVNLRAASVAGLAASPSVSAIGAPVDLAIVAVPAKEVEEVVADCARAGVHGVVVISSGFGESSPEGAEAEKRIFELVRSSGMRMVGPNCMGVLNTDPAISLDATFAPSWPPAGNVAMLSQSGALGIAILDRVRSLGIGLSSFVSVGNKADVSGNDLLSYWAEDSRTGVIVLYLESFGNPRKFARIAPDVAREKPIIAVKSGRSAAGTRAASSHSAALASLDIAVDALFEQAGVIRTNTLEELFDLAMLLSTQPVPPGPRVGAVTNAGGPGILFADACEAHGLRLPRLSDGTLKALRAFLPPHAGLANPVDLTAAATPEQYERAIEAVGRDPSVDALVIIYIPPFVTRPEEVAGAVARAAGRVPREKPVLTVFMSAEGAPALLGAGPRGSLPFYMFPESAALALSAAERYACWRRRPRGEVLKLDGFAESAVRAVIERALERAEGPVWLEPKDLATVLQAVGISFAASEQTTPKPAPEVAERMGYPLVAKAVAPGLIHKSDVGGVILGLDSAAAVEEAVRTLTSRISAAGSRLSGVLLQREVPGGIEALVGVTTDPTFGPLLVCGLGGVLVELIRDVSYRLTPVTDLDAEEMIAKLRSNRLLDGYRGSPPGDRKALVEVIRRVSALVEIVPEIRELDLNPVKVLSPGKGAIAVDGRIRIGRLSGWGRP